MEEKRENLKRAIEGLKSYEAPDVWSAINEKLVADTEEGKEHLASAVDGMKDMPAPDVWAEISDKLDDSHKSDNSSNRKTLWAVAASISLLIAAVWVFQQSNTEVDLITSSDYTTEEVEVFEVDFSGRGFKSTNDGVLGYVDKNCKLMMTKCEDPKFKGLYDTYLELGRAKEELKEKLAETSNKEQLYKYLIRLEKDQTEIGKNLLKMIRYS
ncbi:MAG: hypothetical protein AAFQ94_19010 [Bacteroidota bacterium]